MKKLVYYFGFSATFILFSTASSAQLNIIDSYIGVTPILTQIGNSLDKISTPSDLDFHPDLAKQELWVVNKGVSTNSQQTSTNNVGSSVVIFSNAGEPTQSDVFKKDQNAKHFMNSTTAIAFSADNNNIGSAPGVVDANFGWNGSTDFTGASLWSSDLSVFAVPNGGNGSHLDMVHQSPESQGIASEKDNVFWVFDGYNSRIVRYDFAADHGAGNSNHNDAEISIYKDFAVAKNTNPKISSHMVISDGWVYIVDSGNKKVFRIKMGTGTPGGNPVRHSWETLALHQGIINYTSEDLVTTGLQNPAGIDVIDDRMIVSDYSTGDVILYDITNSPAVELGRIATTATGIMGIKIGPAGKIWYVDYDGNTVNRIDIAAVGIDKLETENTLSVYPNPSNGIVIIENRNGANSTVSLVDVSGKEVYNNTEIRGLTNKFDFSHLSDGLYFITVNNDATSITKKLVLKP